MARDLVPNNFFGNFRLPSIFDWDADEDQWLSPFSSNSNMSSGLSVSEDDKHIYVEAALPGVDAKEIDVTFDKGVLWVRGNQEAHTEDKDRKYYQRSRSSFSYRMVIPGEVDTKKEPQANHKNGIMTIIFDKLPEAQPKKITVKSES